MQPQFSRWAQQSREIGFANQISVVDKTIRGVRQARRKERPRQHSSKHHQRVGCRSIRRQPGNSPENDRKHQQSKKRPNQRPYDANNCLLWRTESHAMRAP